ncbi:MAG: hypothetical protein WCL21_04855 [Mariniphaga sp.]
MQNGEQKIFVWCDFLEGMEDAISHGMIIASILQKELCLFHFIGSKMHNSNELVENRLRGMVAKIVHLAPAIEISYLFRNQNIVETLAELAEQFECLVLVAHKRSVPELLPVLQYAAFPFLFISAQNNIDKIYKQIIVPVGYMKKSKDLALWASYLGRYNSAMIDVFVAAESSVADQKTVKSNVFSIRRLYSKFSFPFQIVDSQTPTWKIQKAALDHALKMKLGMVIIAASFKTTFLDSLLGLTERKVIGKSEELSVMCVNSHRDFYTFCS